MVQTEVSVGQRTAFKKKKINKKNRRIHRAESEVSLLVGPNSIHFCQQLVDDAIRDSRITHVGTTLRGQAVQLVEKQDARSRGTSLVEDISNVAFRLTKPLGQQLRPLNRERGGTWRGKKSTGVTHPGS